MKNRSTIIKLTSALSLVVLALLVLVPSAYAFEAVGADRVVIGEDEVYEDDLYASGGEIVLDGTVRGDFIAAGRTITINGTVEGDLWAAAQEVIINGVVTDDARIAGAVLKLGPEAQIGDDVLAAGYSLETEAGSLVSGSLLLAAGQGRIAGDIGEDLTAGSERLELRGSVDGDVSASVGSADDAPAFDPMRFNPTMPPVPAVPAGFTIAESARIGGDLNYTSDEAADIPAGVVAGEVSHRIPELSREESRQVAEQTPIVSWALDNLRRLVSLVLVGLLLIWLVPAWIQRPAAKVQAKPLSSLGWGALIALLFPFAVLALIVLVILVAVLTGALTLGDLTLSIAGLGLALILAMLVVFSLVLTYLAKLVIGYYGGRLILERINPDLAAKPVWALLLGIILLVILLAIPIFGWLANLVITLIGLGALFLLLRDRTGPAPAAVEPAA